MKRFVFYLIRWQLSTPILAVCLMQLDSLGTAGSTAAANLIGGCVFFFVDRRIFLKRREAHHIESRGPSSSP